MAGLAGLAVVLVAGVIGAVVVLNGNGGRAAGAYRAADDLCGLPEVSALGTPRVAPLPVRTSISDGEPYVSCTVTVATGRYESATFGLSATIKRSAKDAERFYRRFLDMYAPQRPVTEVPGLGAKASWFKRDGYELHAYDDNLFLTVSWRSDPATTDPPPDLISRLFGLGQAVLNACRRPDAAPRPAASAPPPPALPSPSPPVLAFRKVDDLCQVAKFDRIGKVDPATATHRNEEILKRLTMECTVRFAPKSPGAVEQVMVIAIVDTAGKDMGRGFTAERGSARDATDVPGLGTAAFFQPQYIGGPRLLTYQANLQLSVAYFATDPRTQPQDIATRLTDVAASIIAGLRT